MSLNILDIIILLIIAISTLLGIYRGFTKIIIGFFSLGLSFVVTYYAYPLAGKILSQFISNQLSVTIVSIIATYIITVIILSLISSFIIKIIDQACGGGVDKILGGVIGLVRGLLIVQIITTILIIFSSESYLKAENPEDLVNKSQINLCAKWLKDSYFAHPIFDFSRTMFLKLPQKYLGINYETLSPHIDHKINQIKSLDAEPSYKKLSEPNNDELDTELKNILDGTI